MPIFIYEEVYNTRTRTYELVDEHTIANNQAVHKLLFEYFPHRPYVPLDASIAVRAIEGEVFIDAYKKPIPRAYGFIYEHEIKELATKLLFEDNELALDIQRLLEYFEIPNRRQRLIYFKSNTG